MADSDKHTHSTPEPVSADSAAAAALYDAPMNERVERLRAVLDSYGLERSDTQREFHDCMLYAADQLLREDDLEKELDDLLQELGVEELHSEVMVIRGVWGSSHPSYLPQ